MIISTGNCIECIVKNRILEGFSVSSAAQNVYLQLFYTGVLRRVLVYCDIYILKQFKACDCSSEIVFSPVLSLWC